MNFLREGYVRKGGMMPAPSRVLQRPPPPAALRPSISRRGHSMPAEAPFSLSEVDTLKFQLVCALVLAEHVRSAETDEERASRTEALVAAIMDAAPTIRTYAAELVSATKKPPA